MAINHKFRVYSYDSHTFDESPEDYIGDVLSGMDGLVAQLCTGCSDKTSKYIYEGDILSYKGKLGAVEFHDGIYFWIPFSEGEYDGGNDIEVGYMNTAEVEIVDHILNESKSI